MAAATQQHLSPASIASIIFEHAIDGIVVLDGTLTVRALNPAAERLLQWASADLARGFACRQVLACRRDSPWFLSEDARGECLCATALNRAIREAELLIRPRPNQSRLVAASGTPLPLGDDSGVLLVLRPLLGPRQVQSGEINAGSLRLDVGRHDVRVGGRHVHLTPMEFALLRYLLANRERVVPRLELLETVWKYQFDDGSDVVKVHVGSLRHALKEAGATDVRIANVYGVGYMLTTRSPDP